MLKFTTEKEKNENPYRRQCVCSCFSLQSVKFQCLYFFYQVRYDSSFGSKIRTTPFVRSALYSLPRFTRQYKTLLIYTADVCIRGVKGVSGHAVSISDNTLFPPSRRRRKSKGDVYKTRQTIAKFVILA